MLIIIYWITFNVFDASDLNANVSTTDKRLLFIKQSSQLLLKYYFILVTFIY